MSSLSGLEAPSPAARGGQRHSLPYQRSLERLGAAGAAEAERAEAERVAVKVAAKEAETAEAAETAVMAARGA